MYAFISKKPHFCLSFFVKMAIFPSFNKLYAPFLCQIPRYFVISHQIQNNKYNINNLLKDEKVHRIMRRPLPGSGFYKL